MRGATRLAPWRVRGFSRRETGWGRFLSLPPSGWPWPGGLGCSYGGTGSILVGPTSTGVEIGLGSPSEPFRGSVHGTGRLRLRCPLAGVAACFRGGPGPQRGRTRVLPRFSEPATVFTVAVSRPHALRYAALASGRGLWSPPGAPSVVPAMGFEGLSLRRPGRTPRGWSLALADGRWRGFPALVRRYVVQLHGVELSPAGRSRVRLPSASVAARFREGSKPPGEARVHPHGRGGSFEFHDGFCGSVSRPCLFVRGEVFALEIRF